MTGDGLAYLKSLHPDPEPPRRSRIVDLLVSIDRRMQGGAREQTPHSTGGSVMARAEYEYANVAGFLYSLAQVGLDLTVFDNKKVLDLGCGWGGKIIYYSQHSRAISFDGVDIPRYDTDIYKEFARQHDVTNCTFTEGYGEAIPYEDNSFDLVMLDDVLEHVQDAEKTLSECWRVLRPGGELLIRFPSYKMMGAHHLDRALMLPAVHYLLPMKTWAAGLNHRLLQSENQERYVPFARVVATKYHPALFSDLNGLTFPTFKKLVYKIGFQPKILTMLPYITNMQNARRKWLRAIYLLLYKIPPLQEFLSHTIVFLGQKPDQSSN